MNLQGKIAATLFAAALLLAPVSAAQRGHERHDVKKQTAQPAQHKMMMPAMNDAHFVEMMSKHHRDGIEMSKLEEARGTRDEVKALAAKIREGQEKELAELEAHRGKHGQMPPHGAGHKDPSATGTTGHDKMSGAMQKHHAMMEQMSKASMDKIQNATGAEVDHAFAHEMAMHHEMALQMIAKTRFKDPELRKLAQRMSASQKKELAQLKAMQKK